MLSNLFQVQTTSKPEAYWQSLHYFNLFRLVVSGNFVVTYALLGAVFSFGAYNPVLFFTASIGYLLFALMLIVPINIHWPRFNLLLSIQVAADVLFITLLMHASGGISSGLGLLLLVSLVATGMVSRGRLAMFHAAIASIALLLEQTYQVLELGGDTKEYLQTSLTCMGFFATSGLAFVLTRRLNATENLAKKQSIDLANLAQVNQLIIQDMQVGVLVVDESGHVRQHNAEAERLLSPPAMVWDRLVLADFFPALARCLQHWRANPHDDRFDLEAPASGKQIQTRFTAIGADGERLGAVIFIEDLSQMQERAQQLKLAALGRLTANIAHEIRNPLSSISHATQLLQEEPGPDKTHARLLQIISDNTYRLDRIVQDVLQLNRRDRAAPESLSLGDVLAQFAEQFHQTEKIPADAICITARGDLVLHFDRYHLEQVLWNLCRNAWRFSRRQPGSIQLHGVLVQGNAVQLDVVDDGPGVPESLHNQLFEPFFTTDSTGTGLGLYIARELCEANGATLECVESAQGGRFRIRSLSRNASAKPRRQVLKENR